MNSYLKAIPTAICFFFLFSCGDGEKKEKDTTPTDLKQLNAEIARDTMKSEPYYNRGMYHFKNGNAGEAVKDINKAIKLNSGEVKYHLALGDIHFAMNQTGVTIESLRKAHRLEPKNAEVLGKLGELFYIVRKYDSAIFYLNRSLEFESMNPKIHFQKGMVFKELGDTANAIQSFQTATEQNPEYYEPQVQLGWIHSKKGNGICLNYFDNAIRLKPKSIEARYLKGMFFQNKNDFSNAARQYEEILSIDSAHSFSLYNLGYIEFLQGKDIDKAMAYFDRAFNANPEYADAVYMRGICREKKGDKPGAAKDFNAAIIVMPGHEKAMEALKRIRK